MLADRCPNVPEDLDGHEDADGCPELDNDRDGIRDGLDLCRDAPEINTGYADWDGCPDTVLADGTGKGIAGTTLDSLSPGATYYARAYATDGTAVWFGDTV